MSIYQSESFSRGFVPGRTHREGVVKGNLGKIDDCSCSTFLSDGDSSHEDVFEVSCDIIAAGLAWSQTESTSAGLSAGRAVSPADRANAAGVVLTRRVAQASIILLI